MKKFKKTDLKFHLPSGGFRSLSKKYIMECIFDEEIQKAWAPAVGDIIVGSTGNIFVISNKDKLHESLGGTCWYYGGGSCNRDGGCTLDSTYSFTANESGDYYHPTKGKQKNAYHSSIRDFRYVPYPHERKIINKNVHSEFFECMGDLLYWVNETLEVESIGFTYNSSIDKYILLYKIL